MQTDVVSVTPIMPLLATHLAAYGLQEALRRSIVRTNGSGSGSAASGEAAAAAEAQAEAEAEELAAFDQR